jgi:putative ABC transport system permease protein
MGNFGNDIKHSLQMFFRIPGFAAITAIAALALGIGANTAIFTVVNAVLLKPLTYLSQRRSHGQFSGALVRPCHLQ